MWLSEAAGAGDSERLELAAFDNAVRSPVGERGLLAVNVSPHVCTGLQLQSRLEGLERALLERLVIELTEHDQVDDYRALDRALRPWRERGVYLAVDDTGAGHSSLAHVLRVAPDMVKLDRQVICDLDSDPLCRALVAALVTVSASSDLLLVAEGIETAAEVAVLTDLRVPLGQGFHLGRPVLRQRYGHHPQLVT